MSAGDYYYYYAEPIIEVTEECHGRCASCVDNRRCKELKEARRLEGLGAPDFSAVCNAEIRERPNFHNCRACRLINSCPILQRACQPL